MHPSRKSSCFVSRTPGNSTLPCFDDCPAQVQELKLRLVEVQERTRNNHNSAKHTTPRARAATTEEATVVQQEIVEPAFALIAVAVSTRTTATTLDGNPCSPQTYIAALEKQLRTYKTGGTEPPRPPPAAAGGTEGGDGEGASPGVTNAASAASGPPPRDEESATAIRKLTKRNQELQAELEEEKAEVKRR